MEAGHSLQEVFTSFAAGKEMDGKTFAKLAKDWTQKNLNNKLVPRLFSLLKAFILTRMRRNSWISLVTCGIT